MIENLRKDLRNLATSEKVKVSAWFFKIGEGQYGYGDKFLGVTVPEQRAIAKKYRELSFEDLEHLISSEFHEERLTALFILVTQYQKGDGEKKKNVFDFYLKHLSCVNNWDLVDSSAHKIIGEFLVSSQFSVNNSQLVLSRQLKYEKSKPLILLEDLARSKNLWERRVAIISTFAFLAQEEVEPTFTIVDMLLSDKEDLIQKAVGWALREAGKKMGEKVLEDYLRTRYQKLGRTALRYAIERMSKEKRAAYMLGTV